MCGINPVEAAPGFKKILFKPEPNKKLAFAKATVNTAMGLVTCGWKFNEDATVTIEAEVPFNTEADIILPNGDVKKLCPGSHSFICDA